METAGKGKKAETGMGRQGPCPGVLTQENCRKVTRSVEDAEIKTNVLKQNSALLEVRGRGTGSDAGGTVPPAVGGRLVLGFQWECPWRPYAHTSPSKMLETFQLFVLKGTD